jgi:thiamine-monophosphate kinase
MGEFALIERHFRRDVRDASVRLGIGDDAALVVPSPGCELALSVDMLVEGRHFLPGVDPASLGHKTLAVNLSDMAAMGARPRWALLAGALPEADERWLAAFAGGLFALAEREGVALVGGDTTRGPRNLCVTIVGEVPAGGALTRAGARAGDDVWVSGTLGDAMLALRDIRAGRPVPTALRARLERPEPRVALGQRLRGVASAAIDVSDGLTGDLGHILDASKVGARIEIPALPRSNAMNAALAADRAAGLALLLAGGDDYELCFTAPPSMRERVCAAGREGDVAVTRIGEIVAGRGLVAIGEDGTPLVELPRAFDHFST